MNSDEVYYISEHRGAYSNEEELMDLSPDDAMVCLFQYPLQDLLPLRLQKN